MRILKAKRIRKEIKIISAMLPIFIYASLVSLKRRMWKMGPLIIPKFHYILDDWHVSYTVKKEVFCPCNKWNWSLLGESNSEIPTHSKPGSENLGTGLETGRHQTSLSRCGMPLQWWRRRWWLTGSNAASRRGCSVDGAGGVLCSWLNSSGTGWSCFKHSLESNGFMLP